MRGPGDLKFLERKKFGGEEVNIVFFFFFLVSRARHMLARESRAKIFILGRGCGALS